jgi:hypothetical protein
MKKTSVIFAVAAFALSACAVQKQWIPTGGSRSDGVVKLSYEYGGLQVPTVDNEAGVALAKEKCAVWGYSGAQAFGGTIKTCASRDMYGCNGYRVTAEFQCTGQPGKR